jgi:hypothetical protein
LRLLTWYREIPATKTENALVFDLGVLAFSMTRALQCGQLAAAF